MSSTNTRSSSSRTATPSEIGEVRGAYLSSLGAVKPPETIDWSKLLENPGAGGFTDTNRKFQKTRTEPSIPADTADRFLKRGPIAKTSQPLQVRPEDKPSDASRLDKVQALPAIKLLLSMDTSVDSDSSLKGHHDPRESRERQELSATDTGIERPPVVRNLQEAFEREDTPSVDSVDSSTGPAARVLANVHTIEELEADLDLLEEDGNVGRKGSGHHPHSSTRQEAGPGRQSIGSRDVSSVGGYSIEEDFESASEVRTQIEDEENNVSTEEGEGEITEEITEGITEEIAEEEGEVVNTDTLGLEVTEDEEVATETQHMVGGATRQSGRSSDDGDSTSGDTEHSDHTVIESSVVRPSYYEGHSSANGTRSAMPDGLGTPSSTPGGLGTHADGGASSPRTSVPQRPGRHVGVQTDVVAPSWIHAHSCFQGDLGSTPIIPFVVGADALQAMMAYAPSEVAMSNVMRAQLSLTRSLIGSSRQMAESTMRSLNTHYRYTTLKETKEYIAKCKPRVLTVEEAKQIINKRH